MDFSDISMCVCPIGRNTPNGIVPLGTAFRLDKEALWATAAHVIVGDDKDLVIIHRKSDLIQGYQETTIRKVDYAHVSVQSLNPFTDVCILRTVSYDDQTKCTLTISATDEVHVGDQVSVYGYPHIDHRRIVLTQSISHIGAKVLIDSSGLKIKNVVLNLLCKTGQSGSPVIDVKSRSIIGLVVGAYKPTHSGGIRIGNVNLDTIHQTTHVVSAEYVKEMIN